MLSGSCLDRYAQAVGAAAKEHSMTTRVAIGVATLLPMFLTPFLAGTASAQQAAVVTITVNGDAHHDYMTFNDPMVIRATLTWAPAGTQFSNIRGSIVVNSGTGTPGYGLPLGDFSSDFPAGPLVNYGSLNGSTRQGMEFTALPSFFTGGVPTPPSGNHTGIILAEYTVFTNGPTFHGSIEWIPEVGRPNVSIYPSSTSPQFVEVPTTYVRATFTATPAPATLAALVLMGVAGPLRRRRS